MRCASRFFRYKHGVLPTLNHDETAIRFEGIAKYAMTALGHYRLNIPHDYYLVQLDKDFVHEARKREDNLVQLREQIKGCMDIIDAHRTNAFHDVNKFYGILILFLYLALRAIKLCLGKKADSIGDLQELGLSHFAKIHCILMIFMKLEISQKKSWMTSPIIILINN